MASLKAMWQACKFSNGKNKKVDDVAAFDESEAKVCSAKMEKMRALIDAFSSSKTQSDRKFAIVALHNFFSEWRWEMETDEIQSRRSVSVSESSISGKVSKSVSKFRDDSPISSGSESRQTSSASYSCYDVSAATVSEFFESSEHDAKKEPSLQLMGTSVVAECRSQSSIAPKSVAIPDYDNNDSYDSYCLQTVNEIGADDPQTIDLDTAHSAAPSVHESNDDRETAMMQWQNQLQQWFSDAGLTVDILDVAPCDEIDPNRQGPMSERQEVEALRSYRSGLVRQRVNAFEK